MIQLLYDLQMEEDANALMLKINSFFTFLPSAAIFLVCIIVSSLILRFTSATCS